MIRLTRALGAGMLILGIGLVGGCSTSATPTNETSSGTSRAAAGQSTESPTASATAAVPGPRPYLTVLNNTGQPLDYQTVWADQMPSGGTLKPGERSQEFIGFAGNGDSAGVHVTFRNPNWTEEGQTKKTPWYMLPKILTHLYPLNSDSLFLAEVDGLFRPNKVIRQQVWWPILEKRSFPKPAAKPGDILAISQAGYGTYRGVNGTLTLQSADATKEVWSMTLNPYTTN